MAPDKSPGSQAPPAPVESAARADAPPAQEPAAAATAGWTPEQANQELGKAEALASSYIRLGLLAAPVADLERVGEVVANILDYLRRTHGPDAHMRGDYTRGAKLLVMLGHGIKDRKTAEAMVGLPAALDRATTAEERLEARGLQLRGAQTAIDDLQHRLGDGFPGEASDRDYVPGVDHRVLVEESGAAKRVVYGLTQQIRVQGERLAAYEQRLGSGFSGEAARQGYVCVDKVRAYARDELGMVPGSELRDRMDANRRLLTENNQLRQSHERALARARRAEARLKKQPGAGRPVAKKGK